jgi:hypothetical protein
MIKIYCIFSTFFKFILASSLQLSLLPSSVWPVQAFLTADTEGGATATSSSKAEGMALKPASLLQPEQPTAQEWLALTALTLQTSKLVKNILMLNMISKLQMR